VRAFSPESALPLKHHLLWYEITSILGEGGFGITYAATDLNLNHRVAIKEYFPRTICSRDTMLEVRTPDGQAESQYQWGLRRFLDEARTLARFNHPNIVHVRTAFEQNKTAYMVMDLETGRPLDVAYNAGELSTEEQILGFLGPLLHGLAQVHAAGFIHRDIKLQNIIIRPDSTPVLVDFGSARNVIGSESRGLTALVTRGYAPIEQYAHEGLPHPQGPWCDIYSLSAVLYALVIRRMPPDALTRAAHLSADAPDAYASVSAMRPPGFSQEFLQAIDAGLAFSHLDRPATIKDWLTRFPANISFNHSTVIHVGPTAEAASFPRPRLDTEVSERPTTVRSSDGAYEPADIASQKIKAGLRVLVIDDEAYFRSLLLRVLERIGLKSRHAASNGKEALDLIASNTVAIDVILLDLRMPEMDGIEFLRALHDSPYRPAIVLLSGVDVQLLRAATDFARSNHLNVLGYARKPVEPEVLLRLLAGHVAAIAPSSQTSIATSRRVSEEELAAGLHTGALLPVYQPKISLSTGKIVGVETLARWQLLDGSIVGPAAFIPLAETSGLIHELTLALMQKAFADCADWAAQGMLVDLAVNVSAASFADLRFPDVIKALADAEGVPTSRLVLEVTERTVADDFISMMNILVRLRLKGITLSVDDFGTGYSSLQQLHKLPFTELKIDRAFVAGAIKDNRAYSILEASIRLAQKLEMTTIAEGVETHSDLETVRNLGCDVAQGFYYARPMTSDAFISWAHDRSKELP